MVTITSDDIVLMGPMRGFARFAEKHNRAVRCRITKTLEHPNGHKILNFEIVEEDRADWLAAISTKLEEM